MNIQISGQNIELTEALKAHVHEKTEKLNRHLQHIIALSVVLSVEREQQIAEATVSINHFETHASATSTDMYVSIDQLMDKLDKQLLKHKEKQETRRD
ncbi:MAG: ribosome-associated translation inhibitor RaiA [Gammaproteobacteria bacterium]|nr:ribosome-associated translation inhibitor RaiA [Gammaproteobacteria bacterium]